MRRFAAPLLLTILLLALIAALADYKATPPVAATVPKDYAREIDKKREYTPNGYAIIEGNTTTYYDTQGHFRGRTVIDGGAAHYYDHQNRYAGSIALTH